MKNSLHIHNHKVRLVFGLLGLLAGWSLQNFSASAQILYVGNGSSDQTVSFTNGSTNYNAVYVSLNAGDSNNLLSLSNTGTLLTVSGGTTSPGELDIGESGSGSMTISGAGVTDSNAVLGLNAGSLGVVTVSAGGFWSNSKTLTVGGAASGSLTLTGGTIIDATGYVGYGSGSTGTVTVSGGQWNSGFTNSIGFDGTGSLIIGPGGTVIGGSNYSSSAGTTYGLYATNSVSSIGYGSNSFGSVSVNGGLWSNSYTYYYSSFGNFGSNVQYYTLNVGNAGFGSLTISNGGTVYAGNAFLGNQAGSTGSVTVNNASWFTFGNLTVGNGGSGTLTLTNGGTVAGGTSLNFSGTVPVYVASLGYGSNATGAVTVSGGTWDNANTYLYSNFGTLGTNIIYNDTVVGVYGSGSLTVNNGGTVTDAKALIAQYAGSTGSVTINGGNWTNYGEIYVGDGGSGTLIITNGTVYDYEAYIGYRTNSSGSVSVRSGTWINADLNLYVGYSGTGSLSISGSGTVSGSPTYPQFDYNNYIGYNPGSTGSVTITGGTMTNINTNFVGYSGNGTMNISGGSVWSDNDAYVGYNSNSVGSVTVSGGAWNMETYYGLSNGPYHTTLLSYDLYVGNYGSGSVTLSGTGSVLDSAVYIANHVGSTGSVTITGGTWNNINAPDNYAGFIVGEYGSGSLSISGGSVYSGIDYIGYANGATGKVSVSGGLWSNNYFYIGGTTDYSVLPLQSGPATGSLTITGGLVESGDSYIGNNPYGVTNNAVGTVSVSGGTWSNTAFLIVGNTSIGSLTISGSGTVSSDDAIIGKGVGSTGSVTINGGIWTNADSLDIGVEGTGSLTITGGTLLDSESYLGFSRGATGSVTVTGGTWINGLNPAFVSPGAASGDLFIGYDGGTASLTISGGSVYDLNASIIGSSTSTSTVTVSGGLWVNSNTVSTSLSIGGSQPGTLAISGGMVEVGGGAIIGGTSTGILTLSGGTFDSSGEILVGQFSNGYGELDIGVPGGDTGSGTLIAPTIFFGNDTNISGITYLGSGTGIINFNQKDTFRLASDIVGVGTLNQHGSGTTILTGTNSYTGLTTITNGTLLLDGVNTGGGAIPVSGGTLGGTGSTISSVTVGTGGSITPGNGSTPGTLTIGNLTMDAGSMLNIILSGGLSSLLEVSTNATVGGTVNFTALTSLTNSIYTFLSGSSVSGTFGVTNGLPSDYELIYGSNSLYLELIVNPTTNTAQLALGPATFSGTNAIITGGSTNFAVTVSNTATAGSTNLLFTGSSGTNVSGVIGSSTLTAGSSTNAPGFSYTGTNVGTNTGAYTISASAAQPTASNGSVQVIVYNHAEGALLTDSVILPEEHVGYTNPITTGVGITNSNGLAVNLEALASSTNPNLSLGSVVSLPEGASTNVALSLATGQGVGAFTNSVAITFADASTLSGASTNVGTANLSVTGLIYSGQSYWTGNGSGNWTSFAPWDVPGGTPGLDGVLSTNDTATFDARGLSSGTALVTLETNASLMALTFSNAAASYTIGGTGTLTLAAGSNQPVISNLAGSHAINAALRLGANVTLSENPNTTLVINGNVAGTGGFTQGGNGAVTLAGANSYTGPTTITSGLLTTTSHNALGNGLLTLRGGTLSVISLLNVDLFDWNSGIVALPHTASKQYLNVTANATNAVTISGGPLVFNLEGLHPGAKTKLLAATNMTTQFFSTNEFSVENVKGKYSLLITNDALWIKGVSQPVHLAVTTNSTPAEAAPPVIPPYEAPPNLYLSFSTIAFNQANAQNSELIQRLWGVRVAGTGFSMSGFADNTMVIEGQGDGDKGVLDAKNDFLRLGPDNHWGMFADANGIFGDANSGNMLPDYNSQSGGVTTGLTYKWNKSFGTGIYAGYQGSYTRYGTTSGSVPASTLIDNSVRFGLFGTYGEPSGRGFYSDAMIGGGYNNYNVNRVITYGGTSRTATSSPGAGELDSILAGGYDLKCGNWTYGPTTSLQYTYFGANPVNESGAGSLDFSSQSWNASSLLSSLGAHLAYTWHADRNIVVVPQLSLSWQHEFLQNPYSINGSYGNGPGFATTSATPLRDTLYTGVGFTVEFGKRWNTSFFYNAAAGNRDLVSQNIFWSLGATF